MSARGDGGCGVGIARARALLFPTGLRAARRNATATGLANLNALPPPAAFADRKAASATAGGGKGNNREGNTEFRASRSQWSRRKTSLRSAGLLLSFSSGLKNQSWEPAKENL